MQRKEAWGYVMPPLTMVTLATMLRDGGWDVQVLDATVSAGGTDESLAEVHRFSPDVVVINTSTPTIEDDLEFTREVKSHFRDQVTTVAHGIHISVLYETVLRAEKGLDYCVIGEPESTVFELVEALDDGRSVKDVRGLACLDGMDVTTTGPRPFLTDLDILPIPDWSFVDLDQYRLPFDGERFLLVQTNRGCPYRCTFCNAYAYYGRKPRKRSIPHIMKELKQDVEYSGIRNFMIWAEEFILDREFVCALSDALVSESLVIRWVCNSRVDAVDRQVLERIHSAGCWNIAFGIESGVQSILDRANKGITLAQTENAVELAREVGLKVTGHVMLGLPGDTEETMAETHRFVKKLRLDYVQYYCAMPYPGTVLYDEALEQGWLNTEEWRQWEHNYSVLDYPDLKAKDVMHARTAYSLAYYLDPTVLSSVIRTHLRNPAHVLHFARTAKDFLSWIMKS